MRRLYLKPAVVGLVDNLMHWKERAEGVRHTLCGAHIRSNVSLEDWRAYTNACEVPTCLRCITYASRHVS